MKKKNIIILILLFVISISSLIISIISLSFQLNNKKLSSKQIYDNSINSVVEIKSNNELSETYGTGFFINNTTLCTCLHVVSFYQENTIKFYDNISIKFFNSDRHINISQIISYDEPNDICFLYFSNNYFLPISNNSISIGEEIYTISNLNNNGLGIEKGIVSASELLVDVGEFKRKCCQLDLTVSNGSSGAPLLNNRGEIIGVISFRLKDSNSNVIYGICYALLINEITIPS